MRIFLENNLHIAMKRSKRPKECTVLINKGINENFPPTTFAVTVIYLPPTKNY